MSPRNTHDTNNSAANGPKETRYRGVRKRPWGPARAYDSAARQFRGVKAKTNFPDFHDGEMTKVVDGVSSAAPLPPEALDLTLSHYNSGGFPITRSLFLYHPQMNNRLNVFRSERSVVGDSKDSPPVIGFCYSSNTMKKEKTFTLDLDLNFPPPEVV
ncbi:hypothetical protein QVD17_25871 [Tagetes erecta]|uniref:AP2/ERF domain-containing protein n=1 Tax=Tagetes erecta TaxID=13708 RepID=A0AAD8KBX3_TARER|nr:hypothetical protein QVD17_25871 [Tagetes erecta]